MYVVRLFTLFLLYSCFGYFKDKNRVFLPTWKYASCDNVFLKWTSMTFELKIKNLLKNEEIKNKKKSRSRRCEMKSIKLKLVEGTFSGFMRFFFVNILMKC